MAGIKSIAVGLFLIVGILAITHQLPITPHATAAHGFGSFLQEGGLAPLGWFHASPAMLLVLFAYAGTGVIGLAAAETKNPSRTIRTSVRWTVSLITIMYIGSIFLILNLVPWRQMSTSISPFVLAVKATKLPFASFVMNLVLLFAVLSTMNAALYSNVRVLYGLAHAYQAPKALGEAE
jgi:L-asparagine transporter-like permease